MHIEFEKTSNLKGLSDNNEIRTHKHLIRKRTLNDFAKLASYIYELSGCEFKSRYCHLNFRYGACFEQGVSWHSGKL